jgi:RNA polymerase sigma-70 factor (ECF subfamily)
MDQEPAYANLHQELIDRCRVQDREAQFEIYRLYYKAMYNASLRVVQDPVEAEDIMQESFLSAFQKINTYSGSVSFGAWLKKIVINQSLDSLKKKKISFEELDDRKIEINETEDEEPDITNRTDEVRDAIMRLPDGYRVVLNLYLLEGYDHDEIGKILNITSSTSRSQYARARQKLKELLKKKNNG